jgi:hypothetical protein
MYIVEMVRAAWQWNNLLKDTMNVFSLKECIYSRTGIKRISCFVQVSVHPVPCSASRLVKLSKTLHLPSDISCKMARIMVIGKLIYRLYIQHKQFRRIRVFLPKTYIWSPLTRPIRPYPRYATDSNMDRLWDAFWFLQATNNLTT